jgi:predicted membrane protein
MLIMTLLRENFYLQIFPLLVISTLFQLIIVGSKPFLSKLENRMLLFNEIMVSIYLYLLLSLTDFMGDNDFRDMIAWALLSLVVFTVLVNLVKFLIVCEWCYIIRKIKEKCLKAKKYAMKKEKSNKQINELNVKANQSEKFE